MSTTTTGSSAARKSWKDEAPSALIAHILGTHHVYTRGELDRLQALAGSVRELHEARHPELILVGSLIARLCADLLPHMQKEEMILFPFIEALERG
ncbi:MAG TPA: hemerythrin domain-containing protein, partial [Thermoanaerobaculia bacterium]|nr:hemerythrin domain-containing protein [Thermoanaerobaculia bacterium]